MEQRRIIQILSIFAIAAVMIFFLGNRLQPTYTAQASWSISFDSQSTKTFGHTTVATTTITVGTGAYNLLAIGIAASGTTATGVSVDGHAATKAIATSTNGQDAEVWYYLGASSGQHVVSSSFAANASGTMIISSYFGVNQATPLDATSAKGGNSRTPSSTITTTVAGDWIVDMNAFAGSTNESGKGAGQTTIATSQGNATEKGNASYKSVSVAGATSTSWTLAASARWEEVQAAFEVATGTGYTWTDAAGDSDWGTAGNWSGGAVPGAGASVIFSASSTANCNINAVVNVAGVTITSGYTGTITQLPSNNYTITVGSSGWTQSGGAFIGSSSSDNITINGSFSLNAGMFTDTNGDMALNGTSTFFSSGFVNNSGTVYFVGSSTITGSSTFYNLTLDNLGNTSGNFVYTIATGTILTVQNAFGSAADNANTFYYGGGQFDLQGDMTASCDALPASGTVAFIINGAGNQTIGANPQIYANVCSVPNVMLPSDLIIRKASGGVSLANSIYIEGSWNNASGTTISPGTSTVTFYSPQSISIVGSSTFNNLIFSGVLDYVPSNVFWSITIPTGTVVAVNNTLNLSNSIGATIEAVFLGGGKINALGNLSIPSGMPLGTGVPIPFNLMLNGTGTQIISAGYNGEGYFPGVIINKPSGVAYYENLYDSQGVYPMEITGSLNVLQGEFSLSTGTTPGAVQVDGTTTIAASAILSDYPAMSSTLSLGAPVTNNGTVFFDGSTQACTLPLPNGVIIESTTTGSQIPWSGTGNFIMRYVNVSDQGGAAVIPIWDGTQGSDVGNNWQFNNGQPEPELIQSVSDSGGSGTASVTLPALNFNPRSGDLIIVAVSARNQTIAAPTDNAGNVYTLAASSTFGSSPSYALSLYYANNIISTSSFTITAHGNGGGGSLLSASAFEYTGMAPSSTYDAYSANTPGGVATSLTSFSVTGRANNELYFGTATISASTTLTAGSPFESEAGVSNNSTLQALYTEAVATSTSPYTAAATWTAATSTNYSALVGSFRSPHENGYFPTGTLDSATFDTGVVNGAQLNSIMWQGSVPLGASWGSGFPVGIQIAISNSSNPSSWDFEGPSGDATTYFHGNSGTPIELDSSSGGLTLFNGYRYFRYRVTLFADPTYSYTPTVNQITVNWSP